MVAAQLIGKEPGTQEPLQPSVARAWQLMPCAVCTWTDSQRSWHRVLQETAVLGDAHRSTLWLLPGHLCRLHPKIAVRDFSAVL